MHPIKQPDVLLRAWRELEREFPEWRLRLVGSDIDSPGYLRRMQVLAQTLGLRRVDFDGELTGTAKDLAFRSSDLYVLPSKSENFGVTVAEALAMGTPALVTSGAPWAQLGPRCAGWSVEPAERSLTEALRHAMSMPRTELEEMGRRGRDWMEREYRWDSVAQRMLELYDWIITGMPLSSKPTWVHLAAQLSPAQAAWTAERKAEVVLRMLRGEALDALSREFGVSTARLAAWRDMGVSAMKLKLASESPEDPT
jgi:hypothetical protein